MAAREISGYVAVKTNESRGIFVLNAVVPQTALCPMTVLRWRCTI